MSPKNGLPPPQYVLPNCKPGRWEPILGRHVLGASILGRGEPILQKVLYIIPNSFQIPPSGEDGMSGCGPRFYVEPLLTKRNPTFYRLGSPFLHFHLGGKI